MGSEPANNYVYFIRHEFLRAGWNYPGCPHSAGYLHKPLRHTSESSDIVVVGQARVEASAVNLVQFSHFLERNCHQERVHWSNWEITAHSMSRKAHSQRE